jgi:hypothetical protein
MKKLILLLSLFSTAVLAAPVNLTLENGLIANADYQQGKENKPVVMVVGDFIANNLDF